ncbi:Neural cell adhesion molecule 1 [Lamellibrachia satsuma]|nr:Neural cell adhesion molecule 1 [Lamellibrachia satsuma]
MYFTKVEWTRRIATIRTIISVADNIVIDDYLNPVQDGYHKYGIILTRFGETVTYLLIIRRLGLQDAGTYTCTVFGRGFWSSKDGSVVVLVPPAIRIGNTTNVKTMNEGDSVQLRCDADGLPQPSITWLRANGKPLPSPINTFSLKENILNLTNLTHGDRGVYRCIADNGAGPPATYDVTLYINFKPIARPVQSNYSQAKSYNTSMECIIEGYPHPDLAWYQMDVNGSRVAIDDGAKYVIDVQMNQTPATFWYRMTIINIQADDYGDYICEGKNRMGNATGKVHLYETHECQGSNCPAVYIVDGGSTVSVSSPQTSVATLHTVTTISGAANIRSSTLPAVFNIILTLVLVRLLNH